MMELQRIRRFMIEFIIIAASFEISEYFTVQVFQVEKWYVELITYVVAFMLLHGCASYVKRWWKQKKEDKGVGEE